MKRKHVVFILCLFFLCVLQGFADVGSYVGNTYTDTSNYYTALRCLRLSMDYMQDSQWDNVISQTQLGISYSEEISDLWYLLARGMYQKGEPIYKVLDVLSVGIEKNRWLDYNRDSAYILYCQLLSQTGKSAEALEILENSTVPRSADREYIKAVALYRINTQESIEQARQIILDGADSYPGDTRFPLLFFYYELRPDLTYDAEVQRIANIFIDRYATDVTAGGDVHIYAAAFAQEELQRKMLLAFSAAGYRHPLYAPLALQAGIITEEEAYRYFVSFASTSVKEEQLVLFASLLTETEVKSALTAFLKAYDGLIEKDTTGDRITDVSVQYSRGRPATVIYDGDQDGNIEWSADCDFGVPTDISIPKEKTFVSYNKYPYIRKIQIDSSTFYIRDNTLEWAPLSITVSQAVSNSLPGTQFFIPNLYEPVLTIDLETIATKSYSMNIPVSEREDARLEVSLSDGKCTNLAYYQKEKQYAVAECKDGLPLLRRVDMDRDGWFEVVQYFSFDKDGYKDFLSEEEEGILYNELFGEFLFPKGLYISKVTLDTNFDMTADFTEEYVAKGGVISIWGNKETEDTYTQYISENYGKTSRAIFKLPLSLETVTVFFEDAVPVKVTIQEQNGFMKDDILVHYVDGVYWLGKAGTTAVSEYLIQALDHEGVTGKSLILETEEESQRVIFSAVKVNEFYFGVLLDE